MRYRWDLLPAVADLVERGRGDAALARLDDLLVEVRATTPRDPDLYRLRCAQAMSALLRAARRGGAASDRLLEDHLAALRSLATARSRPACDRVVRAFARGLLERAAPRGRTRMERAVAGIRADLRATIHRPRPLATYAADLELSVGHLSREFGRIAGRPFRSEVQRLRGEAALRLLGDPALAVGEVARRVGVSSASQFIADFKRAHGLTPARWRAARRGRASRSAS